MLKLYHCKGARSLRPLWMLEELGLDYELYTLPFPPRVFEKSYLDINPLGTVPAFFDGAMRMTESSAICQYLVDRYGAQKGKAELGVAVSDPEYGPYLNWLYFSDATLTFPQTIVLRYTQLEPPDRRLPQAAEDYRRWFYGRLRAVDAAVAKAPYLCAGRFTAADIAVGYGLLLAEQIQIDQDFSPSLRAYLDRLKARPAFQRAAAR
ncbi:MAG: glutathione S-transferase family protein [Alphaproteobacteria bacterium]|nr:glutathione S-transferase family protein [Alphaproteobacteria bacterium]